MRGLLGIGRFADRAGFAMVSGRVSRIIVGLAAVVPRPVSRRVSIGFAVA
jgi:hypothetical protein